MCDDFNRLKASQIAAAAQTLRENGINPEKLAWKPRQVLGLNPLRVSCVGGKVISSTQLGTYNIERN